MSNAVKITFAVVFKLSICFLDIFLGKTTDKLIYETEEKLDSLKSALAEKNYDECKKKSEELNDKWEYCEDKFSYFIEHDELEKVSSKVAIISENSKNNEYKLALEDSIETKYLLEHIKDKLKLKLNNVF